MRKAIISIFLQCRTFRIANPQTTLRTKKIKINHICPPKYKKMYYLCNGFKNPDY